MVTLAPPSLRGVPLPPCCPLLPLLLRPTFLVLSRSVRRLPLAGDGALARARGARARVGLAGVVEVAVGAAGGVGVAVGVVVGVEVAVAAVEAEAAVAVAVGAEAAVAAEVEAAVVEEVELVGVVLLSGAAPGVQFPEASEIPRWGELSRAGVAIFDLDFDAILAAMYAVTISDEGDCYRCFPPDPGIGTAALGTGEAAALGASASAPSGAGDLYLPSFSTNLVSGADLQDTGVHQFTPASQRVTHCTDARTGRHLATFTRRPGSSLYALTTPSPPVAASGQGAASGQVFAAASRSGPESAPCSCRLLSHETLLWHHRLGHPSLPRLRGMASRVLVSGLPRSLPPLPPGPGPSCVPCVEGRLRAGPHSSQFQPAEAPLQTLHMDVWGPARVRGQGHERYFLLVVDDYSRYTTVFPLRSKGDTFTLPDSPQQNGITERRIGMVMDVARTSMMHAAAPHFLWPFAVRYAAHQINLHPRVSRPETSPALLWTRKVGDASAFRVWGSRAFVRDLSADKLSPRAAPCVFLGFPPDAPRWQFYHPTSRRVLSSQDVTFDESVPYYRTPSLPPPPHFLMSGPPPVDPLPPQGPAPSGVSQVDAVEPVEVAGDSGTAVGTEPGGADSGGAARVGAEPGGAASGGAACGGAEPGGAEPGGATAGGAEPGGATTGGAEHGGPSPGGAASGAAEPGGAESGATEPGGAEPATAGPAPVASGGAGPAGSLGASSRREPLSPQEPREWFARRWRRTTGAGASSAAEGAGAAGLGGTSPASATGVGAAEGVGAEATAVSPGGGPGGTGAGGAVDAGTASGGAGAVPAVSGVAARPRPYFVPLLQQVLGLPPPLECPPPVQSQSQLPPASPLPSPSPYTGPSRGLAERREPASRPASPVRAARTSGRSSRSRPPPVPGTHRMSLRPSTAPLHAPLPSPPESSLPVLADPESDSLRAASPTVTRLLATVVTDPSFESTASALVAELVDFAARCRLDYASSLVAESASVCPPSVGDECALATDVLEDRQEEFQCQAAASPLSECYLML
ncbi:unnamed protein product [Closterium sp. NIES-64]|nr:unnamed protein product [Closterium sp. NIES-64]